jgi:hypothetical protein
MEPTANKGEGKSRGQRKANHNKAAKKRVTIAWSRPAQKAVDSRQITNPKTWTGWGRRKRWANSQPRENVGRLRKIKLDCGNKKPAKTIDNKTKQTRVA